MANVIAQPLNPSNLSISLEDVVAIPQSLDTVTQRLSPPRLNYINHAGDNSGRLFVNDQRGKMYVISAQGELLGTYLDLKTRIGTNFLDSTSQQGFTYFTFHPDYRNNGLFYTVHTELINGEATFSFDDFLPEESPSHHDVILEWRDTNLNDNAFSGGYRELLRIEQPHPDHNTGQIGFNPYVGPDDPNYGNLYIAVADGGFFLSLTERVTAQDLSSPFGKLLRINPEGRDSRNGNYGVPPDNPYQDNPEYLPEILAHGFRNPHRFSWDPVTGRMFLVDTGQASIEEVNLIQPGLNYGWPLREGTYQTDVANSYLAPPFGRFSPDSEDGFTYPVAQYDHDYPGNAIAGGYLYRGEISEYGRSFVSSEYNCQSYNFSAVRFCSSIRGMESHLQESTDFYYSKTISGDFSVVKPKL
ncbi:sorbosone dehydrogenase family protein [Gloeocapsa sp. PCC 73106]|uniref:PQQ-dependent sugar dehydrogenase n=1 Tax=Gloeocapsa sp. PCC 73106 TaxID=102232 RepID=UPI0002ACF92A|nr:PQQ-dependent sugar dehydrogenase [Gloeocapsa sp. PCC 73106]ELR97844.1 Glucose / Sorbosone dehydrogenase [Gloeocapsa sp. PCC 73106]